MLRTADLVKQLDEEVKKIGAKILHLFHKQRAYHYCSEDITYAVLLSLQNN
jgi:hypothetical protein